MVHLALKTGSILGQFTKALRDSVSVNLARSGGIFCSRKCRHHPNPMDMVINPTYACYAAAGETSFKGANTTAKLVRHETLGPAQVVGKAYLELKDQLARGVTIPWARFCTNGAAPEIVQCTPLFLSQLRAFITLCNANGIKVHFPVETPEKAEFYRSKIGDIVTIRESLQVPVSSDNIPATTGPVSFVVGDDITTGPNIFGRRLEIARAIARAWYAEKGRPAIVCPAIYTSFMRRTKAGRARGIRAIKCGLCDACSNPRVDVIYPLHK